MSCPLATENVWTDKSDYHEAEKTYFERLSKLLVQGSEKIDKFSEIENEEAVVELDEEAPKSPMKLVKKSKKDKKELHHQVQHVSSSDAFDISAEPIFTEISSKKKAKKDKKDKKSNRNEESLSPSNNKDETVIGKSSKPCGESDNKLLEQGTQISPIKPSKKSKKEKKDAAAANAANLIADGSSDLESLSIKKPEPPARKEKKPKANKSNSKVSEGKDSKLQGADQICNKEKTISESSIKSEQSFTEIPSKKKSKKEKKEKKLNRDDTSISSIEIGGTIGSTKSSIANEETDVSNVDDIMFEENKLRPEGAGTGSATISAKSKDIKEKKNKADKKKLNSNAIVSGTSHKSVGIDETYLDIKAGGAGQSSSLASEIAKARQHIKNSLERMDGIAALASTPSAELLDRLSTVEKQNITLQSTVSNLEKIVQSLQERLNALSLGAPKVPAAGTQKSSPAAAAKAVQDDDDDDGVDLFASDSEGEDEEAAKVREQRLAEYAAKKSNKPVLIAKSNIILDIKPWDDETDMKEVEKAVRKIVCEGLLWGAAKLVPLAYGICKLQISSVVEDDKVSIDWLTEEIEKNEDLVQSVDIAAFNKI